ncbi:MAG: FG-GAP repeat protein [Deltaproteobacteria bacterium]|nr:FG-GAP repeat protein [Deltaproteobacteria bacterium]
MNRLWILGVAGPIVAGLIAMGCGRSGSEGSFGSQLSAAAPAGSNATIQSHDVPLTMNPGERLNIRVVTQNAGTGGSPANDWSTSYALYRRTPSIWSFAYDRVDATVVPGANSTHDFVIIAPTGDQTAQFRAQMRLLGDSYFGDILTVNNIDVNSAHQRRWSCELVSENIPDTMTPGQSFNATVRVRNSGYGTWQGPGVCLYSLDNTNGLAPLDFNKWGGSSTCVPLTSSIAPNDEFEFSFPITAPSTETNHTLVRSISDRNAPSPTGGVGIFNKTSPCLNLTIAVAGTPPLDSVVSVNGIAATMAPGETRTVQVIMQNTGTEAWTGASSNYALYSKSDPVSFWGTSYTLVPSAVTVNNSGFATFSFNVTAPSTPGTYTSSWQMKKLAGLGAGFFGATASVNVVVDAANQPQLGATVVSQTIPTQIDPGGVATFQVRMRNTGSQNWAGSSFDLRSNNSPKNLWTTTSIPLGSLETIAADGGEKLFSFVVTAPSTPGTYSSDWRMYQTDIGYFGDSALTANIVVNFCSNGHVDLSQGETCDDGNLTNGDGCDSTCHIEPISVVAPDGTASRARRIVGVVANKKHCNVAIGEATGDAKADVVTAAMTHVTPANQPIRNLAGIVYGFVGDVSFFSGNSDVVPSTAGFQVWGADPSDELGANVGGAVKIGDVTNDGVGDVLISSARASGDGNARAGAGEVYVLTGGAALATAGVIDLAANPPHALLAARIIGPAAGARAIILGVADLTGDGQADLMIGAPGDATNGPGAGAVYIVPGPVAGTIDLSNPASYSALILGAAAGDQLGYVAAPGNIGGTSPNDLLVGAWLHSPGGRTKAGGAWAVFGPLSGTYDLASGDEDVAWLGAADNDRYGNAVAIGNVTGTSRNEVVIGASQIRRAGNQVGGVDVWNRDLLTGTTLDLSLGASAEARILGVDPYDTAGKTIALGDINADGYLDIGIAAPGADGVGNGGDGRGEFTVLLGGSIAGAIDLDASPSVLIYGAADRDLMGSYPHSAAFGDVDGDGSADFCVGSLKGGAGAEGTVDCQRSSW